MGILGLCNVQLLSKRLLEEFTRGFSIIIYTQGISARYVLKHKRFNIFYIVEVIIDVHSSGQQIHLKLK